MTDVWTLVADGYARVATAMVVDSGEAAKGVIESWQTDTYGPDDVVVANARLASVAVFGAIGLVDATITAAALVSGTTDFKPRLVRSDPTDVAALEVERSFSIVKPFERKLGGQVPLSQVSFDPPTLPPLQTTFVVQIDTTAVVSGWYSGTVAVAPANSPPELAVVKLLL